MDVNAFINGYRGYGHYNEEKPWESEAKVEKFRNRIGQLDGSRLYHKLKMMNTTYISNEDAPADFLGLQKYTRYQGML